MVGPARDQKDVQVISSTSAPQNDNLVHHLANLESRRIVVLPAQRVISAPSGHGSDVYLEHNASNLPTVLNTMRNASPKLFNNLVRHASDIFPGLLYITTPTNGQGRIEVRLWYTANMDRVSKSISLMDSGTGVAQALAILYVAIYYPYAILVMDEINSFLHPTALKKLIKILRTEYSHHQYIISTHAMEVIAWAKPERVFLARKMGEETTVTSLDVTDVAGLREMAGELGVSMADVFAADWIIWVEGETEEECFPMILAHRGMEIPAGTIIVSVLSTGNLSFGARSVELAYELYRKISLFAAPLVKGAVFSFDREGMKREEIAKLKEMADGRLFILPRRMIENYLLAPDALSSLFSEMSVPVAEEDVRAWIEKVGGDKKYHAPHKWRQDIHAADWLIEVDGAKILSDMVQYFTESRFSYMKTTHTPWLVQWMLKHREEHLEELCTHVEALLSRSGS